MNKMPDPTSIILKDPIVVGEIKNSDIYYQQFHGTNLIFTVYATNADASLRSLVARGQGINWSEQYQLIAEPEWGQRRVIEIVDGAMLAGQLAFQSMYFLHLNDNLPTYRILGKGTYLSCMVQVAKHERAELKGLVLDVFQGVKIQGQSGQWNANSKYLRNGNMIYMERLSGIEWLQANPDLANAAGDHGAYPAAI